MYIPCATVLHFKNLNILSRKALKNVFVGFLLYLHRDSTMHADTVTDTERYIARADEKDKFQTALHYNRSKVIYNHLYAYISFKTSSKHTFTSPVLCISAYRMV